MGDAAMPQEPGNADLMTGYWFGVHPDNPTLGVLRLDTKGEARWVLVTKKGLLALAGACAKHAEELREVQ